MGERHFFWLYRPTLPSVRAQSIQIVHTAHAMALRGHRVQLVAEAASDFGGSVADVLAYYGLSCDPNFELILLRGGRTRCSIMYRAYLAAFVFSVGGAGVLVSRSKKHAIEARRLYGRRVQIVLESHELDSALAAERGEGVKQWIQLEQDAIQASDALVTNAPGTLELWREHHELPPSTALQNGTHELRQRQPDRSAAGVAYVGSARSYKDLETVRALATRCRHPITWIGGDPDTSLEGAGLRVLNSVPHVEIPDLLCSFRVLLLPLSSGVFGEKLSSPLKLWDYMAAGVPIVGADLEALRLAAPGAYVPYTPGDSGSLEDAVERAYTDEDLRSRVLDASFVRTWAQRAAEFEQFLAEVL